MTAAAAPGRAPARILGILAAIGEPVVVAARWLAFVAGLGAAVAVATIRPRTWRRPVRAAFRRAIHEAGVLPLPDVTVAAALIGIGMVFQALYWLGSVGQESLVGSVLTTVLVREVAPVVVGLLVLGRFGIATIIVLGGHARSGRIEALDAQGIDPFLYLALPRVLASALACLCLTILFTAAALFAGWAFALVLSPNDVGLFEFLGNVLRAMGASNFVLLPLKALLIGLVIALVAAAIVLGAPALAAEPARLAAAGFGLMVLATLVVSGVVSMVL
jgi:phospholipid/cholesterol/gamma-HCH transport system permease protein